MASSQVFFTNLRTTPTSNLLDKMERLVRRAGIAGIDFENRFAAIKIHFGEPGNMAYLRPQYAARMAGLLRSLGAKPFLTDANTLYSGRRANAVDHLQSAMENGYNPISAQCQVIIADGLKGIDYREIEIDGEYCKAPKIGAAVADADIVISMTHFKGHEQTGFGGTLKNLGMGGGSRAGKMEMHSNEKPTVDQSLCVGCGACQKICAHSAPVIENKKCTIDHSRCVGCGRCVDICPKDAIQPSFDAKSEILNAKIAEYTKAVVDGRPSFHISIVRDISPNCDCRPENDAPIVPDVGMFASFDPVALDVACADAVNRQPVLPHSQLGETAHCDHDDHDHFHAVHPDTDWRSGIVHAVKLGLGNEQYELITVK